MRRLVLLLALPLVLLAACGGDDDEAEPATTAAGTSTAAEPSGFAFTGGDVRDGQEIDAEYTCDGDNVSPALRWQHVPEGAAELVLVVDDPDAGDGFTHWVAYGIAPDVTSLEAGVPVAPVVSGAINLKQSSNDGGGYGWTGPCPPSGEHHYVFTLFALDEATGLDGGAAAEDVRAALEGHVLAEATLTATYAH